MENKRLTGVNLLVSASARYVGEVLVVRVAGVLTAAFPLLIAPLIAEALEERDARAVVLNLTDTVLALGPAGWAEMRRLHARASIAQPVALVAAPLHEQELRAHCLQMAYLGSVRAPFTDEPSAICWASQCLDHWPQRPVGSWQSRPTAQTAHTPAP